jgi:hypothetical protein
MLMPHPNHSDTWDCAGCLDQNTLDLYKMLAELTLTDFLRSPISDVSQISGRARHKARC